MDVAELLDRIGRCEACGRFVAEDELTELLTLVVCDDCREEPKREGERDDQDS